jgi:hypothetical protein
MKRETTKLFSPIIESQQKTSEATQKVISNISNKLSVETLPQLALELPKQKYDIIVGPIAYKYVSTYLNNEKLGDRMFGIRKEIDGKYYVGNKEVKFDNDDPIIDGIKYKGTPGLWELLTMKSPKTFSVEDENNYREILYFTDARYYPSFDSNKKPGFTNSTKYKFIQKQIDKNLSKGEPNKLVHWFDILLNNKKKQEIQG